MIGPRIFSAGRVLYGGGISGLHEEINNMDEAKSALIRIRAEGGPAAISYKNYNLPSRLISILPVSIPPADLYLLREQSIKAKIAYSRTEYQHVVCS